MTRPNALYSGFLQSVERFADRPALEVSGQCVSCVPFEWQSGFLKCDVRLGPGDERDVKVLYRAAEKRTYHYRRSWSFQSRVFARRMLSDMRDNYLSKSDRLLATAERVKDRLFKDGII